jgi:hypothetical protein
MTDDTSLRAHMDAMTDPAPVPETPAPAPVESPEAPAEVTPETEAASATPDAELSEAARTLRRNRADERKAKIQREIDELVRAREQTRAEIEQIRRDREALAAVPRSQPTTGGVPVGSDPTDPTPREADFPDDYAGYLAAQARWAAREEFRTQQAQTRERIAREQTAAVLSAKAEKLVTAEASARSKYADFDVVVESLVVPLQGSDRGRALGDFLSESEVAGELAYRIAADPALTARVTQAATPAALMRVLSTVESELLAPKRGSKPITAAPAPPTQSVGTGAAAVADDPNTRSLRDHMRIENKRDAERRRARLA